MTDDWIRVMRIFALSAALILGLTSVAQSATLNETDLAGGSFSSDFATPTVIGSGFETVTGTGSSSTPNYLHFTNLAVGAQQLEFTFNLDIPSGVPSFAASSGTVRFSEVAPTAVASGDQVNYDLSYLNLGIFGTFGTVSQTLSYSLDNTFTSGSLYVSILPTFGFTDTFSFGIDVPGNAAPPAPVPIPAAGLLLLAAIGGFAAFGRRKSAAIAA